MTIAQQLNINEFPFEIKDKKGNQIYYENSDGFWWKREYDSKNNTIYCEYSYGYWEKREYDLNGSEIYFENSEGFWWKCEHNSKGNLIYFEYSKGKIIDKRPKPVELTIDQIADKFGINVNQLKIKK